MKKIKPSDIKLVITIALKKEIPREWYASHNIPVHSLAALKAGALQGDPGMLIVITGAGPDAGREAASWIRDHASPLFVLNIGTCGMRDKKHALGKWVSPASVSDENGNRIELDTRMPLPHNEKITSIASLLTVKNMINNIAKVYDAVDMECYAQAEVFAETGLSFHCLKFATDYSDGNAAADFNRNLELFRDNLKKLFSFMMLPFTTGDQEGSNITVIIPVYNREGTIRRAVDSVLSQSRPPKELIVVNDCSTDGTEEILEGYGDKITLIHLSENSGPSTARNEGIKHAKTAWVAFLDSDDCWDKKKIENQIEYLKKYPFYRIMQTDEMWVRNGKRVNPCMHHRKHEGWIWEHSLERCLVSPSGVLAQRPLLEKYGMFDEAMPVCEDYDLWLKISRYHPVGLDPVLSVVKFGGHKDQLSTSYPAMDRFRVESLYRILREETSEEYRQKIIRVLGSKLNVLINGYKKRNKTKDLRECEQMLASLDEFRAGM